MGIFKRVRKAIVGEESIFRTDDVFESSGPFGDYRLRTNRVNYELAREIYWNEHNDYKLGAWAAKPVVNTQAGFMGAPRFLHKTRDDATQGELDEGPNQWAPKFLRANRNGCRDGDVYLRLDIAPDRFDDRDAELVPRLIPPDWVDPLYDPITGELREVVITYPVERRNRQGGRIRREGTYKIVEILTATTRELTVEGNAPVEVRRMIAERSRDEAENYGWGFVPIIHVRNDPEESALYGKSELEPIEPFMRAYHDTFLFALQGAQTIAKPKAQFKLSDVKAFLERNFTAEEIRTGKLRFRNKELFLMQRDAAGEDNIDFLTTDTGLSGIATMLEFLFYCIVDVSQTPEFAFGTAVASSKASVSEQMPVLTRNIRRKRDEYADYYSETGSMFLAMMSQVGMARPDTYKVDIEWEEITARDDAEVATTIDTLVGGLVTAVDGGLMSLDAASDFLAEFVPTMLPFTTEGGDADERQRIAATAAFRSRLDRNEFSPEDLPPGIASLIDRIPALSGNGAG